METEAANPKKTNEDPDSGQEHRVAQSQSIPQAGTRAQGKAWEEFGYPKPIAKSESRQDNRCCLSKAKYKKHRELA